MQKYSQNLLASGTSSPPLPPSFPLVIVAYCIILIIGLGPTMPPAMPADAATTLLWSVLGIGRLSSIHVLSRRLLLFAFAHKRSTCLNYDEAQYCDCHLLHARSPLTIFTVFTVFLQLEIFHVNSQILL